MLFRQAIFTARHSVLANSNQTAALAHFNSRFFARSGRRIYLDQKLQKQQNYRVKPLDGDMGLDLNEAKSKKEADAIRLNEMEFQQFQKTGPASMFDQEMEGRLEEFIN